MHHIVQLLKRGVLAHQGTHLLHYVGTMGSEGMTTEDCAVGGRDAEFDVSLCLVHSQGTSVGAIHLLAHFNLHTLCLQLVLCLANTGSLGIGEYGGRHDVETNVVGYAKDVINDMKALHSGGMG